MGMSSTMEETSAADAVIVEDLSDILQEKFASGDNDDGRHEAKPWC